MTTEAETEELVRRLNEFRRELQCLSGFVTAKRHRELLAQFEELIQFTDKTFKRGC